MGQLKRRQGWWRRTSARHIVLLALLSLAPMAQAQTADPGEVHLQLEVHVNGFPLKLIAAFQQLPGGKIASARSELTELGVIVPGDGSPEDIIVLDTVPGLSYVYDEAAQSIELELPDAARIAKNLDASNAGFIKAESGTGLVVNYTGFAAANYNITSDLEAFNGASLTLDARAFSKYGTLQQTAILGTTTFSDFTALRLDTTLSYSDQERMLTYRLGDIISGGFAWTRPVRLGGAQVQRNFALRPDLITMPLPLIEGSAEVPSMLAVFVGGVQAYSGGVQPGPFRIDGLPTFTESGTARVVLTDSTGRQVESEQEFYTSPDLLKKNLYDFSLEAGVVRLGFGTDSLGYEETPVSLASLRYGITDILTGEAHAEVNEELIDIGIGGLVSAGWFGMFNGAIAGSIHDGDVGLFLHVGWQGHFGDFGIHLSSSRTIGDFYDLAAVTAKPAEGSELTSAVPRAIDQVSLGYSLRELNAGVGLSLIHQLDNDGTRSLILSGSYTQAFDYNITAFVSGFADFADESEYGAFVGFTMPLGPNISTSSGASMSRDGWTAVADAVRQNNGDPGSYGWRVSHGEGDQRYTSASGNYRGTRAGVDGRVLLQDDMLSGTAAIEGSAVVAGGGVFLANPIYDSFAIVDAGAKDVTVEYENRFAGKTGNSGKLILPHLRSYQKNKISIDVSELPLNASVAESEMIVVPYGMSGIVADFGVTADPPAALVILTDAQGSFISETSEVFLEGTGEPFIMGYDGQVYLTGIGPRNKVTVKAGGNTCQAQFDYAPDSQNQTTIGPLKCL